MLVEYLPCALSSLPKNNTKSSHVTAGMDVTMHASFTVLFSDGGGLQSGYGTVQKLLIIIAGNAFGLDVISTVQDAFRPITASG